MKIIPVKTGKIIPGAAGSIYEILGKLPTLREGTIVAVTSKIVAICEGRFAPIDATKKEGLVKKESELYLTPDRRSKYSTIISIKKGLILPAAGIDESNSAGFYVLLPKNPQRTANEIRAFLKKKYFLKKVGVIITDSKTSPLRRGTTGVSIAHSGFYALRDYRGASDLFGRKLRITWSNIADALAAAAVLAMGEGSEGTPLAIIEDVPFVKFQLRNPSKKETREFFMKPDEDLYAPLLRGVKWRKGGKRSRTE